MDVGKQIAILIFLVGIFSLGVSGFSGGTGTSSNPYEISTCQELQDISPKYGSNGGLSDNYIIINDIDCSGFNVGSNGFDPLGNKSSKFKGYLNGNGSIVENLSIDRKTENYTALVGYLSEGGTIENTGLRNVGVNGSNFSSSLVGANNGSIKNSFATGTVNSTNKSDNLIYAGGLAGINYQGSINESFATVNVTGENYVGGLLGENSNGDLNNLFSTGNVSGESTIGGLIGKNDGSLNDGYWDLDSSNQADGISDGTGDVEGLKTSEMKDAEPYCSDYMNGLNYSDTWFTQSGDYPNLRVFQQNAKNLNCPPNANFSMTSSVLTNEDFIINASESSDSDGSISNYEWDLDHDGNRGDFDDDSGKFVVHQITDDGNYDIGLKVTDNKESEDTIYKTVQVMNRPPKVKLSKNVSEPIIGQTIGFETNYTDPDGTNNPYQISWKGVNGSSLKTSGIYNKTREVNVSVTATDYDLAKSTDSMEFNISEPYNLSLTHDGECDFGAAYKCEQQATLNYTYESKGKNFSKMNLTVEVANASGRKVKERLVLQSDDRVFEGEVELPEVNTSKYNSYIYLKFNSTEVSDIYTTEKSTMLETFSIKAISSDFIRQGEKFDLGLSLRKPYSLDRYNKTRFDSVDVNISDDSGRVLEELDINDLIYSEESGLFEADIDIPGNASPGTGKISVEAENIYGDKKQIDSRFRIKSKDAIFDLNNSIDMKFQNYGVKNKSVQISNLVGNSRNLSYNISGLNNQVSFINESLTLSPGGNQFLINANLSEFRDEEGKIVLSDDDTSYEESINVTLSTPHCPIRNDILCLQNNSVSYQVNDPNNINKSVVVKNIGLSRQSFNYTSRVVGEISSDLTVENPQAMIEDNKSVRLNLEPSKLNGNSSGQVIFNTDRSESLNLSVFVHYNMSEDVSALGPPEISVPDSIELGTVVTGESIGKDIEVLNTGQWRVESLSVSSTAFEISTNNIDAGISSGSSKIVNLNFQEVTSSSGDIDITARNIEGSVTETLTVTASPIQNYADKSSELGSRITDLQSSAGSEYSSNLSNLRTRISEIETEWERGNYEEAESTYNEIDSSLTKIESQSSNQDPGTADPQPNNQNSEGSILPILIAVIIIFLVTGFTLYESYIPEKGDPLYSVLGEKQ